LKAKFVHILKINTKDKRNKMSELAAYYNSGSLSKSISFLINKGICLNQIQDKNILIKPNWVKHSITSKDELCMRTNDNFILSALKVILEMRPSKVTLGDAPIQGCNWDRMLSIFFKDEIHKLSKEYNTPILIKDFRRRIYNFSENNPEIGIKPLSDYHIIDLGKNSLLEPLSMTGQTKFRVTNYNPDRMSFAHSFGIHKYCIVKDFFEADIIISLPKIKTHQKAGITGALKNLVGINGDKDFLPHHRIGGTRKGGDCYPGGSALRYWSELSLDKANRFQGSKGFWFWQKLSSILWRLSFPSPEHNMVAGWYGNDTTWRMVMDLNRIAEYGSADGTISEIPQRQIFSLCDGIIAGQGDGPLEPEPLPLGIITFSNDSLVNDRVFAKFMGLPGDRIPLLNSASQDANTDCAITLNGKTIKLEDLNKYEIKTIPPKGWVKYFN
jgi:hypothetical protein